MNTAYLPDEGTRGEFKRAIIDLFCSPLEVGQKWLMYHGIERLDKRDKRIIFLQEVAASHVHFTYYEAINDQLAPLERWGWLTLAEFTDRRITGQAIPVRGN